MTRSTPPIRWTACLFAALGSLALASTSHAQSSDTALAEALFRDGRSLMDQGKLDEACPKFEESQRLVPKLGTLLNLATCHAKQGKTGSAWDEYTRAVTQAKQAGEADREEYARAQLATLDGQLSRLVVRVPKPVEGIEVLIEGKVVGRAAWGTPIPLDPGERAVAARAPGRQPWQKQASMPPGPATIEVEVPELAPAAEGTSGPAPQGEADEATDGDSGSAHETAGWVLGAVGIVGIGVGTGFGINTFLKQGASDDHCNDANECDQEGVDLRSAASTSALTSDIAFGVGLAATVTGIILLLTAPSADEEAAAARGDASPGRWWAAPLAGPGGGQLVVGRRW